MQCNGFLFDLDGTLVDSLTVVEHSWRRWAKRHRLDEMQVLDFIHGKQAITSLRHFLPQYSETQIQAEFCWLEQIEVQDSADIKALPGALALLKHLDEQQIPWAIVTSGSIPVAHARHRAAGLPQPKAFVTAEQVQRGKPEPDAYLLGAALLQLPPERCAVVEDAAAGLLSGLNAGCRVIAVNVPDNAPRLHDADLVLTSLEQLDVEKKADGSVAVGLQS